MSFSDYLENALLNSLFGKTSDLGALASAPTIYVALFTATPNDAGGGTEADYTSYARVSTTSSDWDASASGTVDNANAITFPAATGGSNTVTHFALFDAASAGNLLAYGALDSSLAVSSGITPQFAAGEFDVTLD
jgi:hypothetical protein